MDHFELHAPFEPTGDQPEAIAKLVQGIKDGDHEQTLLGVTGSGKTYTVANVIAQVNKPTLVLAHNKILAAQLCSEFREFFPNNAVEYFVSYYDYYQPEAYIPSTDSYIEKDSSINDEIDQNASQRNSSAGRAKRCYHCGKRFLYLLSGQPGRVPLYDGLHPSRHGKAQRSANRRTGSDSV